MAASDGQQVFGANDGTNGRTRCRNKGKVPSLQALWQQDFPLSNKDNPVALCEGTVGVGSDNSICTVGRVAYSKIAKLAAEKDGFLFAPTAGYISVPGHLISGSSNVVLGSEAFLL